MTNAVRKVSSVHSTLPAAVLDIVVLLNSDLRTTPRRQWIFATIGKITKRREREIKANKERK